MFDSPSPRGRSGGWILPALFWTGLIVLGTAAAVRTAMQAVHVGKTYGELKRKRLIEE